MRKLYGILAGAAALAAASAASAAVIITGVPVGTPYDGDPAYPLTGYTAYKITLASDSGKITAVDFSGAKAFGGTSYSQVWNGTYNSKTKVMNYTQTATGLLADANAGSSVDSFFVLPGDSYTNIAVAGSALGESNDVSTSPFSIYNTPTASGPAYGLGTGLAGAFGITAAAQTTSMTIAYIVIPSSYQGELVDAAVATAGGTFNVVLGPEPASLSFLSLGAAGLIRRRR